MLRLAFVALTTGQQLLAGGQTFNRRLDFLEQDLWQVAFDVEKGSNDSYVVMLASYFTDSVMYWTTFGTMRIGADGVQLEQRAYPDYYNSTYPGLVNGAQRLPDGGYIVGGSRYGPDTDGYTRLVRLTPALDTTWVRIFGDVGTEWIGRSAIGVKDGGFLVCGETSSVGVIDAFIIKTDSTGTEEWRRNYGSATYWDFATSLDTTEGEGYFVGAGSQNSATNGEMWVLRITDNGDTLWTNKWGGPYDDAIACLSTLASGNPIVAGAWGFAAEFDLTQAYMAELDKNDGHIIWERWYGPIVNRTALRVPKEVAPGQGCIVSGFDFEASSINFFRGILLRTAANGDSLWMRSYFYYDSLMTNGTGEFKDVIPTEDGGFIACGYTQGAYQSTYPPGYNQDVWVVKVDSLGCIVPGCDLPMITAQITNLGHALSVYPNPVRDQLHVGINLPTGFRTEGQLDLSVVGMDGKLVRQELVPTSQPNEMVLDVAGLAPGAYTVHLSDAHTWIAGKKFVVE